MSNPGHKSKPSEADGAAKLNHQPPPLPANAAAGGAAVVRVLMGVTVGTCTMLGATAVVFVGLKLAQDREPADNAPAEFATIEKHAQDSPGTHDGPAAIDRQFPTVSAAPIEEQAADALEAEVPLPGPAESFPPARLPPEPDEVSSQNVSAKETPAADAREPGFELPFPFPPEPAREPASPKGPDPFEDIRDKDCRLPLDRFDASPTAPPAKELCRVLVDSPERCELSLHGAEVVFGKGKRLIVSRDDVDEHTRVWAVSADASKSFSRSAKIATFTLHDKTLSFGWETRLPASVPAERLRYCLLKVSVDGQEEWCLLCQPEEIKPLAIDFHERTPEVPIPLDRDSITEFSQLMADVQPVGFDGQTGASEMVLCLGEAGLIEIPDPGESNPLAEIEITFSGEGDLTFPVRVFAYPTLLDADGDTRTPRHEIDYRWVAGKASSLERVKVSVAGQQRATASELASMQSQLKTTESRLARTSSSSYGSNDTLLADRRALQLREQYLQQKILNLEEEQKLAAKRVALLQKNEQWLARLRALFDKLKHNAVLEYRIYLEIEGREVDLLQTTSWQSKANTHSSGRLQGQNP